MRKQLKHSLVDANFCRILVMSLAGFGDVIMATPLYIALRHRYPNAHLTALVMWDTSAALLRSLGVFDQVIAHKFLSASWMESLYLTWQLRRKRFELGVLTYPANRAHYNILLRMINPDCRLGHDYRIGHWMTYGRFLLTHRVSQSANVHNVLENTKLAIALGPPYSNPEMTAGTLGVGLSDWAEEFLASQGPKPYIGIHPGCSPTKNHAQRRWAASKFAVLAKRMKRKYTTPVIFLGPDELELEDTFRSVSPEVSIISHTDIEHVAALIRYCHLFVGSDCSLGHLAAACRIPVVSIVGPTNANCTRPWNVPYHIVSLNTKCSPCFEVSRHPLRCREGKNYACIRNISVQMVIDASLSLLKKPAVDSAHQASTYSHHVQASPAPENIIFEEQE